MTTSKMQTTQEKEIQQLKRALAVEAALEKVRIRTMTMHKSSELPDVALVLVNQLAALNINQLGSSILIVDGTAATYSQYAAHGDLKSQRKVLKIIEDKDLTTAFLGREILRLTKAGEKEFSFPLKGKDLEEFIQDLIDNKVHKARGEAMRQANFECVYFYFVVYHGLSPIVITTLEPLSKSDQAILKRMATTFGMSYRRFLDLQKAESQTRKAEIEAALERVRSTSLAMHHSNELRSVVKVTFEQLIKLDLKVEICLFDIFKEHSNDMHVWAASPQQLYEQVFQIPAFNHLFFRKHKAAKNKAPSFFSYTLNKSQKKSWLNHLLNKTEIGQRIKNNRRKIVLQAAMINGSEAIHKHHGLLVYKFEEQPYSEQENEIILRVSQVFEQAYIRFLDLQKAETQAREAQIEAALERVRARTMAMHKSEELAEAASVLFQQLKEIGISTVTVGIIKFDETNKSGKVWLTPDGNIVEDAFAFPLMNDPTFKKIYTAWKKKEAYYIADLIDKKLQNHLEYVGKYMPVREMLAAAELPVSKRLVINAVFYSHGFIGLNTLEPLESEMNVLQRFASVFEQTYTRFLDLQKAEGQAREAQIEAALERVRAASLAMHKSAEIPEVVLVLANQLENIGITNFGCSVNLVDEENQTYVSYNADSFGGQNGKRQLTISPDLSMDATVANRRYGELQKAGQVDFTIEFEGDDLKELFDHIKHSEMILGVDELIEAGVQKLYAHFALFNGKSNIQFTELEPPTEEQKLIYRRFADAFGMAFTRFLDLQKAEAQAREAQIEAALERVRAKAMSMHKSADLAAVLDVIFAQMNQLGFDSYHVIFGLIDLEKKVIEFWSQGIGAFQFPFRFEMPIIDNYVHNQGIADWQSGKEFSILEVAGKTKREYDEALFKSPDLTNVPETVKNNIRAMEKAYFSQAFTQHGSLYANGPTPLPEENRSILVRFAKVLDLTYTRMLDLQKAETQARELEIVFQENERLLHSILPSTIAEQLKKSPQTIVKRFEEVSILFADIVGFTILSEKLSPQKVVDILNGLFSKFDDLTDKYQLEKIKTIGDAYMVASGVPEEKENHAVAIFQFAQEMLQVIQDFNQIHNLTLAIRIGISSGPVVAGVIGKKKFAYDLWGDTVNTAARMEAYGRASCIQLAPPSYELLKDNFAFEKVPNVEIKGKGEMDVYVWSPKVTGTRFLMSEQD